MPLEPLWTNVLVLPLEEKKSTVLDLPEESKEAPARGTVLAVGKGRQDSKGEVHPLAVEKGDIVVFRKYAKVDYDDRGTPVYFLEESDILAIDRPDAPAAE